MPDNRNSLTTLPYGGMRASALSDKAGAGSFAPEASVTPRERTLTAWPPEHAQPEPALPFWMDGPVVSSLAATLTAWWEKVGEWASWPARQIDPLHCSLPVLGLLAWQRSIERYHGEPERLFRLRVKFAYANGADAGSMAGWKRIFARLELPPVELEERVDGQDWDIVNIVLDDADMPDSQNVLELIIKDYGRTCRRYRFVSRIRQPLFIRAAAFDDNHATVTARPDNHVVVNAAGLIAAFGSEHNTAQAGV